MRERPSRLPAELSPGGRSWEGRPRQHLAGGGGAGGRRWVRKAGPQTIVPAGLQCPGGPESGPAGARSPIRAADTVLRPGVSGGRGRWRGGRRAAAPPGRRASCRGPRGAGEPPGRRPLCGAGSPQLGTKVPLERRAGCGMLGALWGVAGCPCRTWGSLGGGAPSVGRGVPAGAEAGPLARARSPVHRARGFESARGSRARGSPELRRGPERAGLLGRYWGPGVRGPGLCWGPGVRKVPGVRRAPGARSGTSAAASAAGAGV